MLDFYKENTILVNNKCKGILPTNMLTYLVNINSFVSDVYMDDIADMICQIYQYFIKKYMI